MDPDQSVEGFARILKAISSTRHIDQSPTGALHDCPTALVYDVRKRARRAHFRA
jgi:hypothetical protein